ncbi:hypothetical protein F5X97DRAFT_171694 [Nemania serpens]|nr:hypothetical protein F5X97DRAFT_171694 [Nemania serpens]
MIPSRHLLPVLTWLVVIVRADGWDDFSNNLATDLSPLVALFGEQVTKQFLSESSTVLDSFIFALAPLGILTAIVSVIRVCGGVSLRAFIGRAQEGGGIAEAELCSSTSRDVCELYHNGAIVRVFGRPKILEIVHDREADIDDSSETLPECGIYSFQDYIKKGLHKGAGWEEQNLKGSHRDDIEAPQSSSEGSGSNAEQFAPNPNLSFNIGIREQPGVVLWLAAIGGFLIQAAVVAFGFLVTYTWRWTKNDALPPSWGFPLMLLGTILLGGGMFFCAFLIENSTKERVFRRASPKDECGPVIYVVQPGNQIVGDQTFDAFSFTDASNPLIKYTTSWKLQNKAEVQVVFATVTTLAGFILQFVGLRAMHSSVSVFQLGAIVLMSIIRAGLRTRRLAKEQNLLRDRPDEVEGNELDWLALQMAREGPGKQDEGTKFWAVTGRLVKPQLPQNNHERSSGTTPEQKGNLAGTEDLARRIFFYRSRLAELTSQPTRIKSRTSTAWDDRLIQVRRQARQLKQAIESSANILFAQGSVKSDYKDAESIPWNINIAEYDEAGNGNPCIASLSIQKGKDRTQSTTWEVNQHYLEAASGLWAWSIISSPDTEVRDEFNLRVSEASEIPAFRIMATGTKEEEIERARVELKLWLEDFPSSKSIGRWGGKVHPLNRHPGILWNTGCETTFHPLPQSRLMHNPVRLYGWQTELEDSPLDISALTIPVSNSIPITCAHDIYQSFLCAFIAALDSIGGETKFIKGSRGFLFTNNVVTRLVECFEDSGLGDTQDAYSIIVSALRCRFKLPWSKDTLQSVHIGAENSRREGKFKDAEDVLRWTWQTALDTQNDGLLASTMLELGELYRHTLLLNDASLNGFASSGFSWMKKSSLGLPGQIHAARIIADRYDDLEKISKNPPLVEASAQDVMSAIDRNQRSKAMWLIAHVREVLTADPENRTVLSWAAQRGWLEIVKTALELGSKINHADESDRTALSYAAQYGHAEVAEILMARGAVPFIVDIFRRTPLSYAAGGGQIHVLKTLLDDRRVSIMTNDHRWQSPLHWAAKSGHINTIEFLLQHGAIAILDNPDHKGHSPLIVAILNNQIAPAEFLITEGAQFDIPVGQTDAWKWALENGEWICAGFLIRKLNLRDRKRKVVVITIAISHDARSSGETGSPTWENVPTEIVVRGRGAYGARPAITMETVEGVASGQYSVRMDICERDDKPPVYDLLELNLRAYSVNYRRWMPHREIHAGFFPKDDKRVISGSMTVKILELLLDQLGKEVKVTEVVFIAAVKNCTEVTALLLDRWAKELTVTGWIIQAVTQHEDYNARMKMVELLFDGRANIDIGEELVAAVLSAFSSSVKFSVDAVKLLLNRNGEEVEISQYIVEAAAGNKHGEAILKLLLDRSREVKITEHIVQDAAGNYNGEAILRLLLDRRGGEVQVTENIVAAAAGNNNGKGILRLLLEQRGGEVQVTETIVAAAAGSYSGKAILKLLLNRRLIN